ncbi:metal-dependent hydrolase [Spirosoma sordidisoli]|uniref:Metal-dependent hydrolase n=1 Tax=Spirosoma sordidisoli TaxID=2502893 RepID=A0A4V1RWF4_9BACT|nr:metal-dependent hydrolase [Spirosoma sordidisoli]RYC70078.1 metal-dependent hydrolase [Spirosoma sordidisoli]
MQGYNHVAGGIVFTGIFGSFHDVNVFEKPTLIGASVFFALLPDIDHTRSLIGRTVFPLASWLQGRFGHRTVTHSLFFLSGVAGLLLLAPKAYAVVSGYALLSHLLFDMCTKQGVPLLYPFSKRPFVLPANPHMRLSAQDHRSEAMVFVVFLACGFFCQPLIAQGFWTSYNRAFATWDHVEREAKRSRDMLTVTYTDAQKRQRSGQFYRAEGTTMVVLTRAGFELPRSTETQLISFSHSGIIATERQHTLTSVPLDSLNRLLNRHCLRVQVQSTTDLTYFDGPLMQTGHTIDLAYRKNLLIRQAPHDDTEILNRIQLLTIERETRRSEYERALLVYRSEWQRIRSQELLLQQLADEYKDAGDYRKGEIIRQRREVQSRLTTARQSEPLPPLAPDYRRYALESALLKRQLQPSTTIDANLITISTSRPL